MMKLIYQRAGAIRALLRPPAGDSDQAMKASADSASVLFLLAFMEAIDSCKPDSCVLSIRFQLYSSSRYFNTPPSPNDSFILLELST